MIHVYDHGSFYSVSVGKNEIDGFRRRWPASGLNDLKRFWAKFNKLTGDLVDMTCNGSTMNVERFDGSALTGLVADIQGYTAEALGLGAGHGSDWNSRKYLGKPRPRRGIVR